MTPTTPPPRPPQQPPYGAAVPPQAPAPGAGTDSYDTMWGDADRGRNRTTVIAIGAGAALAIVAVLAIVAATLTMSGTSTKTAAPTTTAASAPETEPTTEATTTTAPVTTLPPVTLAPTTAAPATAAPAAPPAAGGTTTFTFPISPAAIGKPSSSHHDYPASDIAAPCGTAYVSPVDGIVQDVIRVDAWNSKTNDPKDRSGLAVGVIGNDGVRYYGSHLSAVEPGIQTGMRVRSGQRLGAVGDSGNAKGSGCELHFGLSPNTGTGDWAVRRGSIWPQKYLASWKSGGQMSPAAEIATFTRQKCRTTGSGLECDSMGPLS